MTSSRVAAVLERLRGRRIHVLGPSGTEGTAVIDFLLAGGITTMTVHDLEPPEKFEATVARTHQWLDADRQAELVQRFRAAPIVWRQGSQYLQGIDQAEVIFVPQSWFRHAENDPVRTAAAHGVPLSSMTHLFFEVWEGPILGVTGTNGKFTVATMIAAMLEAAGIPSLASGNDRTHVPALYNLDQMSPHTWLVLELSNRQLLDLPYSPHVAVVTNVAPHHLDDHGSLGAYVEAKRTIVRHQSAADHAVLNADDPLVAGMAEGVAGTVHWFSRRRGVERGAALQNGRIVLASSGTAPRAVLDVTELATSAAHVVENALAAVAAAAIVGVTPEAMAKVLRAFRGLPYRFHLVGERGSVAFFEDSLATNPTAAAAAISGMTRPFHLIAGGHRRAARADDFEPMVRALDGSPVRAIYLIGATAPILAEALAARTGRQGPRVVQAGTLERALAEAWEAAGSGEAIVLSPGCESFDQFTDYRHRGDRFRALVSELPARAKREAPSGTSA